MFCASPSTKPRRPSENFTTEFTTNLPSSFEVVTHNRIMKENIDEKQRRVGSGRTTPLSGNGGDNLASSSASSSASSTTSGGRATTPVKRSTTPNKAGTSRLQLTPATVTEFTTEVKSTFVVKSHNALAQRNIALSNERRGSAGSLAVPRPSSAMRRPSFDGIDLSSPSSQSGTNGVDVFERMQGDAARVAEMMRRRRSSKLGMLEDSCDSPSAVRQRALSIACAGPGSSDSTRRSDCHSPSTAPHRRSATPVKRPKTPPHLPGDGDAGELRFNPRTTPSAFDDVLKSGKGKWNTSGDRFARIVTLPVCSRPQ